MIKLGDFKGLVSLYLLSKKKWKRKLIECYGMFSCESENN